MMNPALVFVLLVVLGPTSGHFWFFQSHKRFTPVGNNIARGGTVTQSSTGFNGVPERAIDGKMANLWTQNSCTHTRKEVKPWWRLDLLKTYKITTVTITNRRDCCHTRINGAQIRIGNSLNDNGNGNPSCAVISYLGAGATKTFQCKGMQGRYVNIVLPGTEYLTLCEVKVTGTSDDFGNNIARGGTVTQSSTGFNGVPERAIDGKLANLWTQNSCTHTRKEVKPWWRLDLLKTYKITTVTITNRRDCCHTRINGAQIRIGNSLNDNGNGNPSCAVISYLGAGATKTFQCKGMQGRYVNIVLPGTEYLTLCEVKVTGTSDDFGNNIARGGTVTQSSTGFNGVPERAIDGKLANLWTQNSCTHTRKEVKPWWRLDLLKTYKITTVTITNRRDCCHTRINGAQIRIGNSLNDNGNGNPSCAVISYLGAGATKTFQCKGMQGRYVNIVLPGTEYLTLCEVKVTGTSDDFGNNIARGGTVTQSSTGFNGVPERAIDGKLANLWTQNSCTHTRKEVKPWWRLDLLKTYKIITVTITNRRDCCHTRINGAQIRIGNSLNDNGNGNPSCAVISYLGAGATKTFQCKGMQGRYVNIVLPGTEYLTLCEVEVTGTSDDFGNNIARGGTVTQSSTSFNGVPKRAIDGKLANLWTQNSCTHTRKEVKPWWRLDLLKTYKITTVTITNRRDCCHTRINGAQIRIGNSLNDNGNGNPSCAVIFYLGAGATKTFQCKGMQGRYVNIVLPGTEYLTLCEVEVTGTSDDFGNNIARGGTVTQSSTGFNGVPERAIDGKLANLWTQNSCTHTRKEVKPWWRLDLLKTYKITTVTITNRRDCCHTRINGAQIRIGNSLNDNGNGNPSCAVISYLGAGATKTFQCKGMQGRYVNIVLPGTEYLTLCEVEVTGTESDDFPEYSCN